jgi:hypothetical protein
MCRGDYAAEPMTLPLAKEGQKSQLIRRLDRHHRLLG